MIHTERIGDGITSRLTTYAMGPGMFPPRQNAAGEVPARRTAYGWVWSGRQRIQTLHHDRGITEPDLPQDARVATRQYVHAVTVYACTSANSYCGDSQLRLRGSRGAAHTSSAVVRYGVQMFESLSRPNMSNPRRFPERRPP